MQTNLLKESQAAMFLQLSRSFLKQARMKGTGPAFIKLGTAIRYDSRDLQSYLDSRKRQNTNSNRLNGGSNYA